MKACEAAKIIENLLKRGLIVRLVIANEDREITAAEEQALRKAIKILRRYQPK